jgi:hypothetical protein
VIDVADKMLRGKAALTVVRGNPGRHVYRNEIVDPRQVWPEDLSRLVDEGFLEYVVADGEGWKLADDSDDADKGASVTVGSTSADVSPAAQRAQGADPSDPGLTNARNTPPGRPQSSEDDAKREQARADAKAKLPADGSAPDGRAGKDVWVEYAVSKGMDRDEAEKADKADLVAALKS